MQGRKQIRLRVFYSIFLKLLNLRLKTGLADSGFEGGYSVALQLIL